MRNEPDYPATFTDSAGRDATSDGLRDAVARIGERRSYAAPYESLTFTVLTRARRELVVTLAAQPVFDLIRSTPVARRIRRSVRHRGGEIEVMGGLEQAPPEAIDETIQHFETGSVGMILHIAPDAGAARRLSQVRAQCLAIDFAGVEHESARDWQAAAQLIEAARQACPQVMLLNLRPDRGLAAQAAGATHAVFAGMEAVIV